MLGFPAEWANVSLAVPKTAPRSYAVSEIGLISLVTGRSDASLIVPSMSLGPVTVDQTLYASSAWWLLWQPSSMDTCSASLLRGYVAQRLLWRHGMRMMYAAVNQKQFGASPKDVQSVCGSSPIAFNATALISLLLAWDGQGTNLPDILSQLYTALYESGFIQASDLNMAFQWCSLLRELNLHDRRLQARPVDELEIYVRTTPSR